MSKKNSSMLAAQKAKNDEFYTRIEDVAEELRHYKPYFKDKIVLCNCDDPTWSAFWKYFHLNFKELGLKKLVSTHYDRTNPTYKMEYSGGNDNDCNVGTQTPLEGNGDFANEECVRLLDEADIVVTNPPFSLFPSYIKLLVSHEKQFLIIGNKNAAHYAGVFPLILEGKIWLGNSSPKDFLTPTGSITKAVNGLCRWFTNLELHKRYDDYDCVETYDANKFPKFDTYDAIRVAKTAEIPKDYWGVMGVPFTFLDKHNPKQFEIIGELSHGCDNEYDYAKPILNGFEKFSTLLIRRLPMKEDIEKWEDENYRIVDQEEAYVYAKYMAETELDNNQWIVDAPDDGDEQKSLEVFLDWMNTRLSGSPLDSLQFGPDFSDPICTECFKKKFKTTTI